MTDQHLGQEQTDLIVQAIHQTHQTPNTVRSVDLNEHGIVVEVFDNPPQVHDGEVVTHRIRITL